MRTSLASTPAPAWCWPAGAFGLVLAASGVPLVGAALLAPPAALLAGWGAARSVAGPGSTLGRMAALGAGAGLGATLAAIVAFAAFGCGLGDDPLTRALAPGGPPGAAPGAAIGLGAGLVDLAHAALGGLLAGLPGRRAAARRLQALPR